MALSQLYTNPAAPRITKFMAITISPTENVVRLSKIMATISEPSRQPPLRMIRPTPIPSMIPPKIAPRNGFVVIGVNSWAKDENMAIQTMENNVDMVNTLPLMR